MASILESLARTAETINKESSHQRALFCWAQDMSKLYPELKLMFAIPNGGERHKAVASNLKAEGVKSGVPDIFLPIARAGKHGLFIELKRSKTLGKRAGRESEEQEGWIKDLRAQGYGAMTCIGWLDAQAKILMYLESEK